MYISMHKFVYFTFESKKNAFELLFLDIFFPKQILLDIFSKTIFFDIFFQNRFFWILI